MNEIFTWAPLLAAIPVAVILGALVGFAFGDIND